MDLSKYNSARERFVEDVDEIAEQVKKLAEQTDDGETADYLNYVSAAMGGVAMSIAGYNVMNFETWRETLRRSRCRLSEL